jgi:hypothetical protein
MTGNPFQQLARAHAIVRLSLKPPLRLASVALAFLRLPFLYTLRSLFFSSQPHLQWLLQRKRRMLPLLPPNTPRIQTFPAPLLPDEHLIPVPLSNPEGERLPRLPPGLAIALLPR